MIEYLGEIETVFENTVNLLSGAKIELIKGEKNDGCKPCDTRSLNINKGGEETLKGYLQSLGQRRHSRPV